MGMRKSAPPELDPGKIETDVAACFEDHKKTWRHYTCKLVTPMYGGGVEAGKIDQAWVEEVCSSSLAREMATLRGMGKTPTAPAGNLKAVD